MKTKACMFLLIVVPIIACFASGCSKATASEAEMKGDQFFYDETTGKVYLDYSENFDIKIEQWKYYHDAEASQDRILLSLSMKNKTGQELDDFDAKINLNEDAAALVASGILTYDQFEPCSLIPNKTANGASYAIDFLVESDVWLQESNADKKSLLDKIRYVTLELTWKGGAETIELVCDALKTPN